MKYLLLLLLGDDVGTDRVESFGDGDGVALDLQQGAFLGGPSIGLRRLPECGRR